MISGARCSDVLAATHNNCLKISLALFVAPRIVQRKNEQVSRRGQKHMLDAIQISLALWAMIVCGGVKAVQLVHYLF
ncbi:hypothetical protein JQ621_02800 [Bradyrhizobium manausense]|uniref:hypothetical protein n=1 Tax=Bradyrhizobium manausense TaxID=989370 RepID=UPI001BA8E47D|nr:hypothetical protein [Bradyrhizobium manausense]MBR1086399.1 hypothetical protein [Bradyrhizobium manausense]